ncbi:MAG TPA: TraR/DksA family transcriptional regulator [Caldimonas sp.]|jgi:RNA polymerase-binding transcription factor DksA|nr:TraR/DksA family transcriptional regulator [Caldimonas sp.]
MSPLSEAQLAQIRELLARREAELGEEVRAVKADETEVQGQGPPREPRDDADVGDDAVLTGLDHVQLQRDQEELVDIDAARERMRAGTYGLCIECGEPIPLARLLVKPTAKYCLLHQAEWERRHPAAPRFRA